MCQNRVLLVAMLLTFSSHIFFEKNVFFKNSIIVFERLETGNLGAVRASNTTIGPHGDQKLAWPGPKIDLARTKSWPGQDQKLARPGPKVDLARTKI